MTVEEEAKHGQAQCRPGELCTGSSVSVSPVTAVLFPKFSARPELWAANPGTCSGVHTFPDTCYLEAKAPVIWGTISLCGDGGQGWASSRRPRAPAASGAASLGSRCLPGSARPAAWCPAAEVTPLSSSAVSPHFAFHCSEGRCVIPWRSHPDITA